MSKGAQLMYGQIPDVMNILNFEDCDTGELRAALINAFNRIQILEQQLAKVSMNNMSIGIGPRG